LTTNHTSFYREPNHFEFLAAEILPKFRPGSDLRIWSAACSTGEEPYSIVCAVATHWNGQVRGLRVLATDISTRVLEKAKLGRYPEASLQHAPPGWRSCFSRSAGDGMLEVRRDYASLVDFRRINLIEPISFADKFHLIFCRNVMIYFDKATQQGLVERLAAHLEPGGHLFVGHSESLAGIEHRLAYLRPAIYRYDAGKGRPFK
jgi:chemotaxis protein methyltransferase CheR